MGEIFEDIAERVATARTRALMGERQEALALLQRARIDYFQFREVLQSYPGSLALEKSMEAAQQSLCGERAGERDDDSEDAEAPGADGSSLAA